MPDVTVSGNVDTMMRAADNAAIRSAIGLGQTDVPTFAGLNSTGIIGNGVFGILPSSSGISYCDSQSTFRIRHAAGSYTQMFNLLPSGEITLGPTAASVTLVPDAAGILAQRNGTAKQVHRVYNTFLGTTANEWGGFDWLTTANTLRIGTEHGGTGAARPIDFVTGGVVRMTIQSGGNISIPNGLFVTGNIVAGYLLKLTALTVATLPAAASNAFPALVGVSDATMTAALGKGTTVVGGGANKVIVMSDGTNWVIL
jgi:hypothetical protein